MRMSASSINKRQGFDQNDGGVLMDKLVFPRPNKNVGLNLTLLDI